MLAFFQTVFTFYHQGYELAKDFDHYKKALQINIQNVSKKNNNNVFNFNINNTNIQYIVFLITLIQYMGKLYVRQVR